MLCLEDFILVIFCWIDDYLQQLSRDGKRWRSRGFAPKLTDSEVLTMEIVGEFLGLDTDKGIWQYFRRHWLSWFPNFSSRTAFARQAANLWVLKLQMQQALARELGAFADPVHVIDGFPIPVCHVARAYFSKLFRGQVAYGYCATKKETYYGFKGHLLVSLPGVITGLTLTPANTDEREALWDVVSEIQALVLGDKGYISRPLREDLLQVGIDLQTASRSNAKIQVDSRWSRLMVSLRRIIETVIGQLTEQFHIQKTWARDLWHQRSRIARKLLSHTFGVFLNLLHGRSPLQFDGLIAA